MSLPYDYARCYGVRDPLCEKCRRRDPGHPTRQVFIAPAWDNGECRNLIQRQDDDQKLLPGGE